MNSSTKSAKKKVLLSLLWALIISLNLSGCGHQTTPNQATKTSSGVIFDATINGFSIQTETNQQYRFATNSKTIISDENGLLIGEGVEVTYTGDLTSNPLATKVEVISDVIHGDNVAAQKGTITAATMQNITIKTPEGESLSFTQNGNTVVQSEKGLLVGDKVEINYAGEFPNATATLIVVVPAQ